MKTQIYNSNHNKMWDLQLETPSLIKEVPLVVLIEVREVTAALPSMKMADHKPEVVQEVVVLRHQGWIIMLSLRRTLGLSKMLICLFKTKVWDWVLLLVNVQAQEEIKSWTNPCMTVSNEKVRLSCNMVRKIRHLMKWRLLHRNTQMILSVKQLCKQPSKTSRKEEQDIQWRA